MRWPLINQILFRMLLLLIATMAAITYANIQSTISASRTVEEERLKQVLSVARIQTFPLTENVLEKMQILSGAEFVVVDSDGSILFKTDRAPDQIPSGSTSSVAQAVLKVQGEIGTFFYARVNRTKRGSQSRAGWLYVFVQRQDEATLWWQASRFPMLVALVVLPLAFLVSFALASQVTRPLNNLERQVKAIAAGSQATLTDFRRNDELGDLSQSVNHMVVRLGEQEKNMRQNERFQTLLQVGNGVAHQLRNSATGCKMALELLADEFQAKSSESYDVACRQLALMDNYIRNFLQLSKRSSVDQSNRPIADWSSILDNVVSLLRPSAEHLGVEVKVERDVQTTVVPIVDEDAEQIMMNLISNGIAAASDMTESSAGNKRVDVRLKVNHGQLILEVSDTGPGPPKEIADTIFDPFVTGSPEGTGLGLSLVNDIATRVGGEIAWIRENEMTTFTFLVVAFDSSKPPGQSEKSTV